MTTATLLALGTIASSLVGSGLLSGWLTQRMTRKTNADTEELKHRLDQGTYLTRAHYDLELDSYKTLWASIGNLRSTARAVTGVMIHANLFEIRDELVIKAYHAAKTKFTNNHNESVTITELAGPFYHKPILLAARELTTTSGNLDFMLTTFLIKVQPELWNQVENQQEVLRIKIDRLEELIRARLVSIRLIP